MLSNSRVRVVSVAVVLAISTAAAGAWPHKQGQIAQVRFLATSTLVRGTWGWNEDTYLAELRFTAGGEPLLVRLVDAYPNEGRRSRAKSSSRVPAPFFPSSAMRNSTGRSGDFCCARRLGIQWLSCRNGSVIGRRWIGHQRQELSCRATGYYADEGSGTAKTPLNRTSFCKAALEGIRNDAITAETGMGSILESEASGFDLTVQSR